MSYSIVSCGGHSLLVSTELVTKERMINLEYIQVVLLLLIILLLIQINSKIPPRDYVEEALERDRQRRNKMNS